MFSFPDGIERIEEDEESPILMRLTNFFVIIFISMYVTISFRGSNNNKTTISTPEDQKSSFSEVTIPLTV